MTANGTPSAIVSATGKIKAKGDLSRHRTVVEGADSDAEGGSGDLLRGRVLRVHGLDELIDHAVALERLGPATTRSVGILSTSGGAGVVATEAAERAGLELPAPSAETAERLAAD